MDPLKQQTQQESRLHFLDYWRIIRIRKTVIIAVFLLVVITATLVTFILPEQFASYAAMKVQRDTSDIQELQGDSMRMSAYDPYYLFTEENTIQSEAILTNVITTLDLNNVWGKKYNDGVPLKTAETLAILRGRLDVKQRRNTTIIDVKAYSDSPTDAAHLANAVADTYKQWRLESVKRRVNAGVEELEDQLKQHDEKLNKAKEELAGLRKELQISDFDDVRSMPMMLSETEEFKRYTASRFELEQTYKGQKERVPP